MKSFILSMLCCGLGMLALAQPAEFPAPCSNPSFGIYGFTASINGVPAEAGDWVAAFDPRGNIAGRVQVGATAPNVALTIYAAQAPCTLLGDPMPQGMNVGEEFSLFIWDASTGLFWELGVSIAGWSATTGFFNSPTTTSHNFTIEALPVELRSFTAKPNGYETELEWITDSETSNSHFEVEHSVDGRTFTKIGRVDGAGTTLETQYYEFTHAQPASGVNHYRLKQVDFDQSFAYSPVVTVNFDRSAEPSLRLYPNPTKDRVTITLDGEWQEDAIDARLFDLDGKVVAQLYNVGLGTINTELPDLAAGVYMLTVSDGRQIVKERLVIQ